MIERLTDRERQILDLAAQHLTSKQIGPRLGIRPASVDTFMQTIIRKLGVAGRKEAVIAYLAEVRGGAEGHRDDLDFGSSPVAGDAAPAPSGRVIRDGDPALSGPSGGAHDAGSGREETLIETARPARVGVLRRGERTPARRLVAVAIAALLLGLVTVGAVAFGYGLNLAFDRWLDGHGKQPHGLSGQSPRTQHARPDWSPRRHPTVFG